MGKHFVFIVFMLLAPQVGQSGLLDSLTSLGDRIGGDSGKSFLPPDKAFVFSADVQDAQRLLLHWQVADGYHLYRNKFKFRVVAPKSVAVGDVTMPKGRMIEDESFGLLESYFEDIDVPVTIRRPTGETLPIDLEVGYQGCADDGFCYPPIKKRVSLVLPGTGAVIDAGTGNVAPTQGGQNAFLTSLTGQGVWTNLAMMFGAGVLLAFTPCVFPMVPILSAIIIGQGRRVSTSKSLTLTLIYVLAMAVTYTIAGVLAGLFGQSVQAFFQNPWIIGSFSLLFIILALSMFGLYELQMPESIQRRVDAVSRKQNRGTYVGAAIMGFLSALIVGPCIAAPLAGVLLYISTQGDALIGGLSLFSLSLGMGLPLLVFGASAGKLLPKAGPWMHVIRPVFGVMMLALAIWMLERILSPSITLFLWACLAIVSAVYMGGLERLPDNVSPWRKLSKALGMVLFLWGGMLIVGSGSGAQDVFRPLSALTQRGSGAAEPAPVFERLTGLSGLNESLAQTKNVAPVMVDFYAEWCVDCKRMEAHTFSDPRVKDALRGVRLLQADVTLNDADDQALLKKYRLFGPPAILLFDINGREMPKYRMIGFQEPAELAANLKQAFGENR